MYCIPAGGPRIDAVALVSAAIVTPEELRSGAVLVRDGRIESIRNADAIPGGYRVVECPGALLPGFVDAHVHINEPGRTEWEGFATATRAAAAGGFTTVVDMPLNCLPATTTVAGLEAKRSAAKRQCQIDWAAWGGVSGHNSLDLAPLAGAGVRGFKCFLAEPGIEGFARVDEAELRAALPHLASTGLPLLVHAELPEPLDRALEALAAESADARRYSTWLCSRPDEAELAAIRLMIGLCREYRFPLHIVHLATAQALDDLRQARAEGLPITVETCPHYLYFSAENIPDASTLHKCAPPIRSATNREQLWQALRAGEIDLLATDHSPCPPAWKRQDTGDFLAAWGGIASLAVAVAAVWTGMAARGFSLVDLAHNLAERPARLAGLGNRKGRIAPGCDADFAVFAPEERWQVTPESLHTRHALSPYVGETLTGRVVATWLRGEPVYANGAFPAPPRGQFL